MLPPVVERAIAPPFPTLEEASKNPALMSIAPVPPVTLRVISPPVPAPMGLEPSSLVVILPPAVERVMAPPFPVVELDCRKLPVVSIAPGPPVTVRVMFPALRPGTELLETSDLVVMLPPAVVEREIAPEFPAEIA